MAYLLRNINCKIAGLVLALSCSAVVMHATHRALIIGIGEYPTESGWGKINGDKDVPLVEEMLISNHFPKENILKLVNSDATYNAICQAFETLITESLAGDCIYVHLSCHGQQITDLNGDETDGRDEAFIPYDAMMKFQEGIYEGERHLVDDQLNEYLHRLRQRVGEEGRIIVVADACHSGGGTRKLNSEEEIIRGTNKPFTIENVKSAIERLAGIFRKGSSSSARMSSLETPSPQPVEWLYISACKDYQYNTEYQGFGSLTAALYQERNELAKLSLDEIFNRLQSFYRKNIRHPQTPTIEKPQHIKTEIFF